MNKLMGFYELKDSSLPSIPWKVYTPDVILDDNLLWTIRSAVYSGNDLNLPRLVGATSKEAKLFADDLHTKIGDNGMVIYYPFFVAKKSGTLNVFYNRTIIEAVKDDLWNLVTDQKLDASFLYDSDETLISSVGDKEFLSHFEVSQLLSSARKARHIFRQELAEGDSILLEWSFALTCDINKEIIGDPYLVFYEARTL